ncbi:NAD-dependent DNA ligase LigA [Haliovirga abyssi]|uniref:DNA ligase n=1 Tax=Haliovirga abyssi TaxID=2996794 RepID=A0AAU9DE69_9FUSO|nr:NAD-dependent DNA ligase LigA [Haliovirga abyssi]BDU49612.1 DNA ligase [Haliovirga abyssi]
MKDISEKILSEIKELRELIDKYNYFYYAKDESIISDYEYDMLTKKLEKYEKEYPELINEFSPTQLVGKLDKNSKFKKVEHKVPMLSLANTYGINDIKNFNDRVLKIIERDNIEYVLELKLDGLSISLNYENGKLKRGVTRGDGKIGEDVTENILQINSIPKYLKENINIEVRGEVILPLDKFKKINKERIEKGQEVFANPRNAAAGTLRQLDSKIVKERELDCYVYYLVNSENYNLEKHSQSLEYMKKLGFKVNDNYKIVNNIFEITDFIKEWEEKRKELNYETDGLVIKVNEYMFYEELGYTTKSPRWAIAYKFPTTQVTTKLISITYQIGRTGVITPVANLEPVRISGSMVRRATLHNFEEIARKDIRIGDIVFVEKAAEIIPQVVKPVIELRTGEEKEVEMPTICPSCREKLYKDENEVALKCVNNSCPEKLKRKIEYFVSRDAMNIEGLGPKLIERFINEGYIKNICDIYKLEDKFNEISEMENFGIKSIENLLESINKSKTREYNKVLYSLGIPYVGKFLADTLSNYSKNIVFLMQMSKEELLEIDGVGEKVASSVIKFFQDENNREIIEKLKQIGLNFEFLEKDNQDEDLKKLIGKTFLVTGTLKNYKRSELKDIIEKNGGKNVSSVSKKLNYLIVGENPGSKFKKAEVLGIPIINEDEFFKMI